MDAYRHHAFISYAWADDQPFDAKGRSGQSNGKDPARRTGWVSTFHDRFRKHLGRAIGRIEEGERIWLDYEKMRGSDAVSPSIAGELKESALLVPILSKSWFASPWCRTEFETFVAEHPHPLERLFPVWMEQVGREELTRMEGDNQQALAIWDRLHELLGYQFWYRNDEGRLRTRWFPSVDPTDRYYGDIQQDLARDMADRLVRPKNGAPEPEPPALDPVDSPHPCDPPVPPVASNHLVMINGGSGDAALIQDIARTLFGCEGLGHLVPLMAKQRDEQYSPSVLRRDLRESLKLATSVLMVVHRGPEDQINEQVREYLQAAAKRAGQAPSLDVCHLGEGPLGFQVPGMRVHRVTASSIADCACDFARGLE